MVHIYILSISMSLTYFGAFQIKVTEHKPFSWTFTVEWVAFLRGIRKLTGSNTGCDTDYLHRGLLWFSSVPTCNRDSTAGYNIAASFHIFTNSLTNSMELSLAAALFSFQIPPKLSPHQPFLSPSCLKVTRHSAVHS
jgi:hypothetical protein